MKKTKLAMTPVLGVIFSLFLVSVAMGAELRTDLATASGWQRNHDFGAALEGGTSYHVDVRMDLNGNVTDVTYAGNSKPTFVDSVGAGTLSSGEHETSRISITAPCVIGSFGANSSDSDTQAPAGLVTYKLTSNHTNVGVSEAWVNLAGTVTSLGSNCTVANHTFEGFGSPVNNNAINTIKGGQAVPLKWRLLDPEGDPVLNLDGVTTTATTTSCPGALATDPVEEIATGSSGLQNLGDGYYQFNWKTPKTTGCRTLELNIPGVTFASGEGPPVLTFQLK